MKGILLLGILLWTSCTAPNGDLWFVDNGAICRTATHPYGPSMECARR